MFITIKSTLLENALCLSCCFVYCWYPMEWFCLSGCTGKNTGLGGGDIWVLVHLCDKLALQPWENGLNPLVSIFFILIMGGEQSHSIITKFLPFVTL